MFVTLDVKNAFDLAKRIDPPEALKNFLANIEGLFEGLFYKSRKGQRRIRVASGAAKGSIIGLDL